MSHQGLAASGPQVLAEQPDLRALTTRLRSWLIDAAYPVWSRDGVDWRNGGFFEHIDQAGVPGGDLRRARVTPRQVFAFAQAPRLGWTGDAARLVAHGLDFIRERLLRPDGLYRTLADATGGPGDPQAVLYDQAFILLGLAEAGRCLGHRPDLLAAATDLRARLLGGMRHRQHGFMSGLERGLPLLSNPHMHLLEAALAWRDLADEPGWAKLADEIGTLALTRMIDPEWGCLREYFDGDWMPAPGIDGRIVEPGHQFEWAWLLLRWRPQDDATRIAARRLIDVALAHGLQDGVAVNSLLDGVRVHDGDARLWPQTEWLKATTRATEIWGMDAYGAEVARAANALLHYLRTPIPGLWFDRRSANGIFGMDVAPAGNLYHIVAAIAELVRVFGT